MQLGLVRDIVKVETSELSLEILTEIACDFTDNRKLILLIVNVD